MNATISRRTTVRQKSFLPGRIHFNNRQMSVECLIRDVSSDGAKLKVSESISLPEMIELYITGKDEYRRARIQWRRGNEVGLAFIVDNIEAPALAPGAPSDELAARVRRLEADVATLQRIVRELRSAGQNRQSPV